MITKIALVDLNEMLLGKLDMRRAFLNQSKFWTVQCGENGYSSDVVLEEGISKFPTEYLPKEGDKYVLYDEEHKEYQKRISKELREAIDKIVVKTVDKEFFEKFSEGNDSFEIEFFDMIQEIDLVQKTTQTIYTNNEIGLYAA